MLWGAPPPPPPPLVQSWSPKAPSPSLAAH